MSAEDFHTFCLCRTWQPRSERLSGSGTVGVAKASALKDAQCPWLSNSFLRSTDVTVRSVNLGSYQLNV